MSVEDNLAHRHVADESTLPTTIMIVEDNPTLRMMVEACLKREGHRVIGADNGRIALEVMAHTVPDLIISDIIMPELDGFDLFRAVRNNPRWWNLPFILLTAKSTREDMRYGKMLGVEDYLVKPFNPDELRVAVTTRMRRAREVQRHVLREMDVLKERLMAVLSHEFNTSLTNIRLAADLLSAQCEALTPESIKGLVDMIRRGESRLSGLLRDVLVLLAIDSGVEATEFAQSHQPFRLTVALHDALDACRTAANERGITLNIGSIGDDWWVDGVERQVTETLTRIVWNAVKFSPERSDVRLRVRALNDQFEIAIEDDGCGIPLDHQERVFERFYQVDREAHEQQGGGLGLSIAKAFVDLHGGRIAIDSVLGEGSTFTVWLPRYTPQYI